MMEQVLYPVIVLAVCGVAWYAVGNAAAASAKADAAQVRTYRSVAQKQG